MITKRELRTLEVLTGRTEALQCQLAAKARNLPYGSSWRVVEKVAAAKNALLAALREAGG